MQSSIQVIFTLIVAIRGREIETEFHVSIISVLTILLASEIHILLTYTPL